VTDKDRYGSSLGKKWAEKVRPVLCAVDSEELQAPEVTARYIHSLLRKQVKPDILRDIRRALKGQRGFFDGEDTRGRLDRKLTGTVGGEHLLECTVRGVRQGSEFAAIMEDFAARAIAATRTQLKAQRSFKDDAEGQAAFERHAAATQAALHRMFLRDSGLKTPKGPEIPKASTADLLNFVVARDE
jgi:hypothetical protein